jgi:nitrate reductase cytochrome c-type subunit
MKIIRITILLLSLLLAGGLLLNACTAGEEPVEQESAGEETAKEETGNEVQGDYVHEGLAAGEPGDNIYSAPPPGLSTKLPREYPGAPPLIPHNISGFTITKDSNPCMGCHETGLTLGAGGDEHTATKVPESHYTDAVTGEKSDELQDARYICNLCHLSQTEETSLVTNN